MDNADTPGTLAEQSSPLVENPAVRKLDEDSAPAPTGQVLSEDRVWAQLHFYFSDSNLPRDKFLLEKVRKDPDGYVDLSILCDFKRMRQLESSPEGVVKIFSERSSHDLVLSEDRKRIRRIRPIPDDAKSVAFKRTVRVRGWPYGGPEPSLEDLFPLFGAHGSVLSIRLHRSKGSEGETLFVGSAFVELCSPDDAKSFAKAKIKIPGSSEDFEISSPSQLVEERKQLADARRHVKTEDNAPSGSSGQVTAPPSYDPGLILRYEGVGPGVSREDIRELLEPLGDVRWVDYGRDEADGFARFSKASDAQAACAELQERKSELGGKVSRSSPLNLIATKSLKHEGIHFACGRIPAFEGSSMEHPRWRRRNGILEQG